MKWLSIDRSGSTVARQPQIATSCPARATVVPSTAMNELPPIQQFAAPGKWPIVGERLPAAVESPWTVECAGLVNQPVSWTLDAIAAMPQVERRIDIHCVTRWSKLGCVFRGVPLVALIETAQPAEHARFVS